MKKVAIIGATGAIGRALLDKFIKRHIEVYVLVRKDSTRISDLPKHPLIHVVECGMEQMKDFDESILTSIDTFYYLAWAKAFGQEARNDMDTQIKNIQYTLDAVGLAKRMGATTFVGTGSQAEYGRVEGILSEKTPCNPENGYGMAKLCAGQMSRIECEKQGLKHIWTRILSVYGPHDGMGTMISSAIVNFSNGISPDFTLGEQLWDYLYSTDAANALYLMGEKGIHGSVYVLGSGQARPLREYIEIICNEIDTAIKLGFGNVPYGDKQVMHLEADIHSLTRDTGFVPETSFENGIRETIKKFRNKN